MLPTVSISSCMNCQKNVEFGSSRSRFRVGLSNASISAVIRSHKHSVSWLFLAARTRSWMPTSSGSLQERKVLGGFHVDIAGKGHLGAESVGGGARYP